MSFTMMSLICYSLNKKILSYIRLLRSYVDLKNNLIRQGRCTDAVDDILIKFLISIKNANDFILFSIIVC